MTWEVWHSKLVHILQGSCRAGTTQARPSSGPPSFGLCCCGSAPLDPSRHMKRCFSRQPHCSSLNSPISPLRLPPSSDCRQCRGFQGRRHTLGGRRRSCAQPSAFPTSSWLLRRDQTFATPEKNCPDGDPCRHGCSCAAIIPALRLEWPAQHVPTLSS